jgi:hypothetical protein
MNTNSENICAIHVLVAVLRASRAAIVNLGLAPTDILQIQMLDHMIVGASAPGRSGYFSFKEAGVIG